PSLKRPRMGPLEKVPLDKAHRFGYSMVDESIRRPARGQTAPDVIEFVPKQELERAQREIEKQQREIERLQQEIQRLRKELEAALRASKRQAAPHSRGEPKADPQRPGRKSGSHYGQQACRPVPSRI